MTNIFFRINSDKNIGLGHIMRCLKLYRFIESNSKFNPILVFDNNELPDKLLKNTNHIFLYKYKTKFSQSYDAHRFKKKCNPKLNDIIIIDDYRINYIWEKTFFRKCKNVVVIDDLFNKKHRCNIYINYKYKINKIDYNSFKKNNKHLEDKNILLGHNYYISDQNKIPSFNNKFKNTSFNILLYNGGSGDILIFKKLIDYIIKIKKNNIKIILIKGLFVNYDLKTLNEFRKNKDIQFIENKINLKSYLMNADLFIGSSGNMIYDNSISNLPSIFFSTSSNQNNNIFDLQLLGHYFLINKSDIYKNYQSLYKLINCIMKKYSSIQDLYKFKQITIDNLGAQRIFNKITSDMDEERKNNINNNNFLPKMKIKYKKISDHDINKVLFYRNKKITRGLMLNNKTIKPLDHYNWWFKKNRNDYFMTIDNKEYLYIWDKIINLESTKFFFGGWFKICNNCNFAHIYQALKWQLVKKKKYKIKWIAIINKNNKFVLVMNKNLGFKKLKVKSKLYKEICSYFGIKVDQFFIYKYEY